MLKYFLVFFFVACSTTNDKKVVNDNDYLYLEEIKGEKSLQFVNKQNKKSLKYFKSHPEYSKIKKGVLEILDDPEKIPYGSIYGKYIYNFWKDKKNVRGLLRRMPLENYIKKGGGWEVVINIDELAKKEKENWVYKGIYVEPNKKRLALVKLSRGGKDAHVRREFDLETKKFNKSGFTVMKEAKTRMTWINEDEVYIGTDFGKNSLNDAGYPRLYKKWKRGHNLSEAVLIDQIKKEEHSIHAWNDYIHKKIIIIKSPEWYKNSFTLYEDGKFYKYPLPEFARLELRNKNRLLIQVRKKWKVGKKTFHPNELIELNEDKLKKGIVEAKLIFKANKKQALRGVYSLKSHAIIYLLENVKTKLIKLKLVGNKWKTSVMELPQPMGKSGLFSTDALRDDYFFYQSDFLNPVTLYYRNPIKNKFVKIRSMKPGFDSKPYEVKQFFAKSFDGEKIPYFIVKPKKMKFNGLNPTWIYAYGGFQITRLPFYSKTLGKFWYKKGGIYVLANIRGGGEYGARWHSAALKENRQVAFNDFYAVIEDLIKRKITTPKKIGINGGSNGGLLVGAALTQKPELFNAVICDVPLLDMLRYHKLLAGKSWVGEYGNPDIESNRKYISKYSPFQNLKFNVDYPEVFFYTSTMDDRVHPGHARKMVSKMLDMNYPVIYYENTEGGHAGTSNNIQSARKSAMQYIYMYNMLGIK